MSESNKHAALPGVWVSEKYKKDYGVDLGVTAGDGLRDDPYVVDNPHVVDSNSTAALVGIAIEFLRYIAFGTGTYWRSLEFNLVDSPVGNVLQIRIEKKYFTETTMETTVNYIYFRMVRGEINFDALPIAPTYEVSQNGFRVPDEFAWVHRQGRPTSYEEQAPGLGVSFPYGCTGVQATLYIYDRELIDIDPSPYGDAVVAEFEAATAEIMQLNDRVEAWGSSGSLSASLLSGFVIEDDLTVLCIGATRQAFLKFRISFSKSSGFHELFMDSIQAFDRFVESSGNEHQN